jgi:hypothetical protein
MAVSPPRAAIAVFAAFLTLALHSDATPQPVSRLAHLPRLTLWAWERPEDLRRIDPQSTAVAYLDQTLTIGLSTHSQPRLEPLFMPTAAQRIPVIRIETQPHAILDRTSRDQAIAAILETAQTPGIAALQIDFDATRSQRAFYRDLLTSLRPHLPANLPLSITALASWCSYDNWIHNLPIDEAVPMYFRMEPDRRRAASTTPSFQIRESLCQSSIGVSTTEPWPAQTTRKRIYVFPDQGWRNDFSLLRKHDVP